MPEVSEMKIGPFAKKFGIAQSAVRYYITLGLLIPETVNGQSRFNRQCEQDMQDILGWKEMGFSLQDISELITLKRKFNFYLDEDISMGIQIYRNQEAKLKAELKTLYEKKRITKQLINDITECVPNMHRDS